MRSGARLLVRALRDPGRFVADRGVDYNGLIAAARAERLIGTLGHRLEGLELPAKVEAILEGARRDAAQAGVAARWEAEMARRAIAPLGVPVILLKGTAFHAAGLEAARGRLVLTSGKRQRAHGGADGEGEFLSHGVCPVKGSLPNQAATPATTRWLPFGGGV